MLKFAGIAKEGDIIKAMDFRPCEGREDSYVIGRVLDPCDDSMGFHAFKIEVVYRVFGGKEMKVGSDEIVYAPHEVSMLEYDERISLIKEA